MKKILLLIVAILPGILFAQEKKQNKEAEQIIITKKGTDNEKMNIVVDGDNITVNGKPVSKNEDADITVKRVKIKDLDNFSWTPEKAFNGGTSLGREEFRIMRSPNKAMLGVTTQKTDDGVSVISVSGESAAEKAGLKEGDIITAVDSKKIESPDDLSSALKDNKPGDKVTITYTRDGKKATTTAALTEWSAPEAMTFNGNSNFTPDMEDLMSRFPRSFNGGNNFRFFTYPGNTSSGPKLGIKIQDIESAAGVKVIEVEKDSNADKAGLKEGDIIKEADGKIINDTNDMMELMQKSKAGATMKLKIDRNGRTQNMNVLFSKKIKTANL